MNKLLCHKITGYWSHTLTWFGLVNQLFILASMIIKSNKNKNKILILENFLTDINIRKFIPVNNVIDINKFNIFLREHYNLEIYDKNNINFVIKSIKYGSDKIKIDLTDELKKYYNNDRLFISNKIDLNKLKYDPIPNYPKKLFIEYSINNKDYEDSYDEYCNFLKEDILYSYQQNDFWLDTSGWWPFRNNKIMFDHILKNIVYQDEYHEIVKEFMNKIDKTKKINILHLRVEDDATNHWNKFNNLSNKDFKNKLEEKYINLIEKYINKEDQNIILSYSTNNKVIDYLKENNYKYYFIEKKVNLGREVNALIDFLISQECNNIFIGNFDMNNKQINGSTFSYLISILQKSNIKQILITLENINKEEDIYYNSSF
jgi:hypothetical protein